VAGFQPQILQQGFQKLYDYLLTGKTTFDLMKKKLKKNPILTVSQMKMRMRIENATTSIYTDVIYKLL
jgi:hypothetical protein